MKFKSRTLAALVGAITPVYICGEVARAADAGDQAPPSNSALDGGSPDGAATGSSAAGSLAQAKMPNMSPASSSTVSSNVEVPHTAVAQATLYGLSVQDYDYCRFTHNYCVDSAGNPFGFEVDPELHAGETLHVSVFARVCPTNGKAASDAGGGASGCTFELDAPNLTTKTTPYAGAVDLSADWSRVTTISVPTVSTGTLALRLRVYAGPVVSSDTVVVDAPLTFNVNEAGFYFEPIVLFPTVFNGNRMIVAPPLANGEISVVGVEQSDLGAIENVAVGINVYPFGYVPVCNSRGAVIRLFGVCKWTDLLNPLTLQAAVSVSNDAFRSYYTGVGYTLIRGVSATFGAAFEQGQFFGQGLFNGEILSAGSASVALQKGVETKYMIRPYFGVSITPSIIASVVAAINSIKTLAPAPQSSQQTEP